MLEKVEKGLGGNVDRGSVIPDTGRRPYLAAPICEVDHGICTRPGEGIWIGASERNLSVLTNRLRKLGHCPRARSGRSKRLKRDHEVSTKEPIWFFRE